ncbi:MAG: DUF4082 domain-containing protein [Terracidiphilus sp.]|jgi:hypothetical protein
MSKKIFGLFILAVLLLPFAAKADTTAWEYTSPVTTPVTPPADFTMGVVFTPTASIIVDELGYFDDGGITTNHAVGIYNSSGTLIASTIINSSSSIMTTNFAFNTVTPVELLAGSTYVLEGVTGTTDDYTNQVIGLTSYLPISVVGYNYQLNGGNLANDTSTGFPTVQFFGADFGGSIVPEPTSFLLLGSGLAGLAGLIKRKLTA